MEIFINFGIGISCFVLGLFLNNYLVSYFSKKGSNKADKEDLESLTKLTENIKNEFAQEFESFKKSFELKFLELNTDKEIFLTSYEYSLKQAIILDKKVSDGFWLYLDRDSFDNQKLNEARNTLLELRRFIFDSASIVDGEIIQAALEISIAFDRLIGLKEKELFRKAEDDYFTKLAYSISSNLDIFKKAVKTNYKFSSGKNYIENFASKFMQKDSEQNINYSNPNLSGSSMQK
ncbi:MAG: hypothetical protein KA146_09740 [Leptospiraceae bacterium]|nr:hypothetical protein [Leptospiraceae bacterium]